MSSPGPPLLVPTVGSDPRARLPRISLCFSSKETADGLIKMSHIEHILYTGAFPKRPLAFEKLYEKCAMDEALNEIASQLRLSFYGRSSVTKRWRLLDYAIGNGPEYDADGHDEVEEATIDILSDGDHANDRDSDSHSDDDDDDDDDDSSTPMDTSDDGGDTGDWMDDEDDQIDTLAITTLALQSESYRNQVIAAPELQKLKSLMESFGKRIGLQAVSCPKFFKRPPGSLSLENAIELAAECNFTVEVYLDASSVKFDGPTLWDAVLSLGLKHDRRRGHFYYQAAFINEDDGENAPKTILPGFYITTNVIGERWDPELLFTGAAPHHLCFMFHAPTTPQPERLLKVMVDAARYIHSRFPDARLSGVSEAEADLALVVAKIRRLGFESGDYDLQSFM